MVTEPLSLYPLLDELLRQRGSDLYLTEGYPPGLRVEDKIKPLNAHACEAGHIRHMLREVLTEAQIEEFNATKELNTALCIKHERFRLNVFQQQQAPGMVLRHIRSEIPTLESLGLPASYAQMIMEKRGLILLVGPTGSGKTTSLAAMLGHRNRHGCGHIVTVEDPIEYVHRHQGCMFTQRDVGIDTASFGDALKNALRQRPDIIVIGEVRDTQTMEHAINFAETGHLCLATLHANNANQTIERVLNFFPEEKHRQILVNLSLNLKAIFSQRLVENVEGTRSLALEIMMNRGLIRALIEEGKVREIKEMIEKNRDQGMVSFDQSLLDLVVAGKITEATAIAESDNPANLRLHIKQHAMGRKLGS